MKSCPKCNRTFDDSMSFCLEDGAVLSTTLDSEVTRQISSSNESTGQNVNTPLAFADETPTVIRSSGITKLEETKQIPHYFKKMIYAFSIFFLLVAVYTQSIIPFIVGFIVIALLFSGAKIYTKLQKK